MTESPGTANRFSGAVKAGFAAGDDACERRSAVIVINTASNR